MRYWSEGLGKRELVMGLDRSKLERKEDCILLTGVVDSPAPWEYEVKIFFDDFKAILNTATTTEACDFLATRVGLIPLFAMARSIVTFLALLVFYRTMRLLGLDRRGQTPVKNEPVLAKPTSVVPPAAG